MMKNEVVKTRRGYSQLTLMLFLSSLFPVGVLAAWSPPGEDFQAELTLGGPVTNSHNPWSWKLMPGDSAMSLSADEHQARKGERVWSGLLKAQPILLGKTTHTIPAGREGLAPRVSYVHGIPGASLNWLSDGEGEMTLPVYDDTAPLVPIGELSLRLQAAMVLRAMADGQPVYSGMYSDLTGNGLPPEGKTMPTPRAAALLCGLFAGEGPEWLCAQASTTKVGDLVPLSRLTDSRLRQPQGVYGANIIAGSGELRLQAGVMPSHWKSTLSVNIEYQ